MNALRFSLHSTFYHFIYFLFWIAASLVPRSSQWHTSKARSLPKTMLFSIFHLPFALFPLPSSLFPLLFLIHHSPFTIHFKAMPEVLHFLTQKWGFLNHGKPCAEHVCMIQAGCNHVGMVTLSWSIHAKFSRHAWLSWLFQNVILCLKPTCKKILTPYNRIKARLNEPLGIVVKNRIWIR